MDLNINVARAQSWQAEVKGELAEVKVLLKEVSECCQRDPVEDDPIISEIVDTGQKLSESWNTLTKTFDDVLENIGSAIQTIGSGIQKSVEAIKEYKDKIGR